MSAVKRKKEKKNILKEREKKDLTYNLEKDMKLWVN